MSATHVNSNLRTELRGKLRKPPGTPVQSGFPYRRDRRDLPDVTDHPTGALLPPVSPSALSSAAVTVKVEEGPRVRFCRT